METGHVAIRQTCDNCASSKVRCDGEQPCKRCARRGQVCFYRPKKRRTKVIGEEKIKLAPDFTGVLVQNGTSGAAGNAGTKFAPLLTNNMLNGNYNLGASAPKSLNEYERRTWSVFFTLFRNFNSSCSAFWFSFQLRKMLGFLDQAQNEAAKKRFQTWLHALNIVPANSEADVQKCMQMLNSIRFMIEKPSDGIPVVVNAQTGFDIRQEAKEKELASIEVDQNGIVTTNPKFDDVFGISGPQLTKMLVDSGGGLLPWGGDVIARILPKESDIIAFIQILAIQLNSLGRPNVVPCIREVPTVHVMTCVTKDNKTYNCMVKCLHREVISKLDINTVRMEFFMSFIPMNEPMEVQKVPIHNIVSTTKHHHEDEEEEEDEAMFDEDEEEEDTDMSMPGMSAASTPGVLERESSIGVPLVVSDAPDLLASDYLGNDDKWLEELLEWTGVPPEHPAHHNAPGEMSVAVPAGSPDPFDLLPFADPKR